MKISTDIEKIQMIGVLRVLGCSQDEVAQIVRVAKLTVKNTENWIKQEQLEKVKSVFDDDAIKRVVGRDLPGNNQIEHDLLVRAGQVKCEDVLMHFRQDYNQSTTTSYQPVEINGDLVYCLTYAIKETDDSQTNKKRQVLRALALISDREVPIVFNWGKGYWQKE